MRKLILSLFLALIFMCARAQTDLSYYLPQNVNYDPKIPTPESVIGYQIGKWHITHDKLLKYMEKLAEVSSKVTITQYGKTYEDRSLVLLTITSEKNHSNIEQIKKEHLVLSDPQQSKNINIENMPVFVWLGYNVHGNEASAANSTPLVAYYLAAAQGEEIEKILENTIILIDPCINPDGLNRYASWVNMHKSRNLVTDPNSREFSSVWPGGRTNHYWVDLNRDWLLIQQSETKGRLKKFHEWKPNILTDHHEMGTSSTFFFQPGIITRTNPLTPKENITLTKKIATYHAKALDKIGSLYYSEERFDDFYYGKGSTYPDINGSIGILFEQASSRGHAQESNNVIITFPFTIKNQFTVSLSTIEAAQDLRKELLEYQRTTYTSAIELAIKNNFKAYVFGNQYDQARNLHFIELLKRHQINVYNLSNNLKIDVHEYESTSSYIVPLKQPQYRLIQAIFEKVTQFEKNSFYDVSAWTLPLSFGLPYAKINSKQYSESLLGDEIVEINFPQGKITGNQSEYAYLFKWDEYYTPRALNRLLKKDMVVKVATNTFVYQDNEIKESFDRGTILIPVKKQPLASEKIFKIIEKIAQKDGIDVYALKTGLTTEGIDIGSGSFSHLRNPNVLLLVGDGISSNDAGEVWHLLDQRFKMQLSMVEQQRFNRMNLNRYKTIVMVNGSYGDINDSGKENLKRWISEGGTLIAMKNANQWLIRNKIINIKFKSRASSDSLKIRPYAKMSDDYAVHVIRGAILEANLDITHPLCYGYHNDKIALFKNTTSFANKSRNPYSNPVIYTEKPLLSGYISNENIQLLKNSAAVLVNSSGRGKIISFIDNPNFRDVWYGTSKLFVNAIFFGHIISGGSRY